MKVVKGIPSVFNSFLTDKLHSNSFGYIPDGIWGIRGVGGGYSAIYTPCEKELTVILVRNKDQQEADKRLVLIRKYAEKRGEKAPEDIKTEDLSGFTGKVKYKGNVFCLLCGTDMVMVSGYEDACFQRMEKTAEDLLNNLNK